MTIITWVVIGFSVWLCGSYIAFKFMVDDEKRIDTIEYIAIATMGSIIWVLTPFVLLGLLLKLLHQKLLQAYDV